MAEPKTHVAVMEQPVDVLTYVAEALHVSMQTARRLAKRNMIEGVFRVPGTKKWLVHKPTFERCYLQRVEDSCLKRPDFPSSSGPEASSGKSVIPHRMDQKCAALLGPRITKRLKDNMKSSKPGAG